MSEPGIQLDIRALIDRAERLRRCYRRRLLALCLRRLARAWRHRDGAAHLRALDDRELHDMGLSRSDIEAAAHGLFR